MVTHLGRLRVVTRRKEGRCSFKYCEKENKVTPGEQVLVLTRAGQINDRMTIFYKAYHPECFGPWVMWRCSQIPPSKDGRKVMGLEPEAKQARRKLVETRARLLRQLRVVTSGDKLTKMIERITALDESIRATGYPVIPYAGRKGVTLVSFDKFVAKVKEHYGHPLRVGQDMHEEAKRMGMGKQFDQAMREWEEEVRTKAYEQTRTGSDYESQQEDPEDKEAS